MISILWYSLSNFAADQPEPQCHRQHKRNFSQRNVEFLRDGHHDQQKHREVERVEGPAEPGRNPRQPLSEALLDELA
jgi:hypothetical protein